MAERDGTGDGIADRPLAVELSKPRSLCDDGFRPYPMPGRIFPRARTDYWIVGRRGR